MTQDAWTAQTRVWSICSRSEVVTAKELRVISDVPGVGFWKHWEMLANKAIQANGISNRGLNFPGLGPILVPLGAFSKRRTHGGSEDQHWV
jgi:hypothetical protein